MIVKGNSGKYPQEETPVFAFLKGKYQGNRKTVLVYRNQTWFEEITDKIILGEDVESWIDFTVDDFSNITRLLVEKLDSRTLELVALKETANGRFQKALCKYELMSDNGEFSVDKIPELLKMASHGRVNEAQDIEVIELLSRNILPKKDRLRNAKEPSVADDNYILNNILYRYDKALEMAEAQVIEWNNIAKNNWDLLQQFLSTEDKEYFKAAEERFAMATRFWETSGSICNIDDLIKIAAYGK